MIGDSRVPSMAAEALAIVLVSHGDCRVDWAKNDRLLSVVQLLRYHRVWILWHVKGQEQIIDATSCIAQVVEEL